MSYVTKDSGERQTFSTGMVRDSAVKELRPDLLPVAMLRRLAEGEIFDAFLDWFEDDNTQGDSAAWLLECIIEEEKRRGGAPMIIRWAELMGRGAIKYGDRNWEKARTPEELERFKASAFRHFVQWLYDVNKEEDHAAGVFFNVAGAEYVKDRMRPKGGFEVVMEMTIKPGADPFKLFDLSGAT